MPEIEISRDGTAITLHVPITLRRIGGRKMVVSPDGEQPWAPPRPQVDGPLVNALARAFRWKDMLDAGRYATVEELAEAERMNASFLARVLRLTLLAPDIVEAILDGRQPPTLQLQPLIRKGFPLAWGAQRQALLQQTRVAE
ncbi:hypothetical protein [Bauldia litoralis]|uniref:Bacteriophage-related protein n=1 Tax=Bauldia litoralis TaxID=665467 RepID=A0A1G6DPX3_9HYPH|nr:hypothetical protein [Bauldia litoralis]SDB47243.1 hypothetical protein SAMN02982931_03613 [Bauldia litoralis]